MTPPLHITPKDFRPEGATATGSVVTLPYPPSANKLWRFVPGQPTPLKSEHYRKWLKAAKAELCGVRRIAGPFQLTITAVAPDRRQRDLDNLAKPILDALKGIAFEDDHLCRKLTLEWAPGIYKGGTILAQVEAA